MPPIEGLIAQFAFEVTFSAVSFGFSVFFLFFDGVERIEDVPPWQQWTTQFYSVPDR